MVLLVLVAGSATAQQLDIADLVDLRFPGLGLQREASTTSTTSTTTTSTTTLDTVAEEGSMGTTEATPRTHKSVSPNLVISIVTTYTNAYIGQAVITYLQDVILK